LNAKHSDVSHVETLIQEAMLRLCALAAESPGSTELREAEATFKYLQSKLC